LKTNSTYLLFILPLKQIRLVIYFIIFYYSWEY